MMTVARFERRRVFYWLLATDYCLLPCDIFFNRRPVSRRTALAESSRKKWKPELFRALPGLQGSRKNSLGWTDDGFSLLKGTPNSAPSWPKHFRVSGPEAGRRAAPRGR